MKHDRREETHTHDTGLGHRLQQSQYPILAYQQIHYDTDLCRQHIMDVSMYAVFLLPSLLGNCFSFLPVLMLTRCTEWIQYRLESVVMTH